MGQLTLDASKLTTHDGNPLRFYGGQSAFLQSLVPRVALLGGFGSGKSLTFCFKALLLAAIHGNGYKGQLVAPTYDMLQRILIPTLRDDLMMKLGDPENGMSLWDLSKYSISNRSLMLPNGFEILFGSADNPNRIRGSNLAFLGLDEAAMVDHFQDFYVSAGSRLRRARKHPITGRPMSQFFLSTTPEGLDSVYEKFCVPPTKRSHQKEWESTHQVIRVSTFQNPGITNEFLREMLVGIPEPLIPAYLHGQHIDIGRGLCYYNFSRESNVNMAADYDPSQNLYLSFGFGADPCVATVHQMRGHSNLMTIDEIYLRNSSTVEVVSEIIRRYGTQGLNHKRKIIVTGDATDAVGISNYDEIMDYLTMHFLGDSVIRRVKRSNAKHYRRLKSVNALAKNAAGEVRWMVNPRCVKTLRDVTMQRMENSGLHKNKKQDSGDGTTLGHCSDTIDYVIDLIFPFRRRDTRSDIRNSDLVSHVA